MARFDPLMEYPKEKDYRESRPVDPIRNYTAEGNKAWGILAETLGKVGASTVTAVDQYNKDKAQQATRDALDPITEKYTADLEATYAANRGNRPTDSAFTRAVTNTTGIPTVDGGGGDDPSAAQLPPWLVSGAILPKGVSMQAPLPDQATGALNRLEVIEGLRKKGEISGTQVNALRADALKDVRAQYPNYREQIDAEASRILSSSLPANAYVTSLMGDINSWIRSGSNEKDKILSYIRSHHELPSASTAYKNYAEGAWDANKVVATLGREANEKHTLNMLELQRKNAAGVRDEAKVLATDQYTQYTSNSAYSYLNRLQVTPASPGVKGQVGLAGILEYANKIRQDPTKFDPQKNAQLVVQLNTLEAEYLADAEAYASKQLSKDGRPIAFDIRDPGEMRRIATANAGMFKTLRDNLSKDNIPIAGMAAAITEGMTQQTGYKLMSHPQFGDAFKILNSPAMKNVPKSVEQVLHNYVTGGGFVKSFGVWLTAQQLGQIDPNDPKPTAQRVNETIYEGKKAGFAPAHTSQAAYSLVKQISSLAIPAGQPGAIEDQTKVAFLTKTFDPTKDIIIDEFGRDQPGIIGKYGVWKELTSAPMTAEIKRLADKHGSHLFTNYELWARKAFADIFRKDIIDLNAFSEGANVSISWDTDRGRFKEAHVIENPGRESFRSVGGRQLDIQAAERYEAEINRRIARLNDNFESLHNIAKAKGINADEYMIEMLAGSGYAPMRKELREGSDRVNVTQGLPSRMFTAILSAQEEALAIKKEQLAIKKEQEEAVKRTKRAKP